MKVCPYCKKRIRYKSLFKVKKKGVFYCDRCKKESKVKINNKLLVMFLAVTLIALLFIIIWCANGLANNFLGVIIVALIFFSFYLYTPLLLEFVGLKKYVGEKPIKNNDEKINEEKEDFVFNKEIFEQIKRERAKRNFEEENKEIKSPQSTKIPIIEDVKEGHISSSDEPLHKINRRKKEYYKEEVFEEYEEVKKYRPRQKRENNKSRYTANRKL